MCTAVWIKNGYFGRNLDYEVDFGEKIIITPGNFPFEFTDGSRCDRHHTIIGMGVVRNNYPLYFDGMNDAGLAVAGLRFYGNAVYFPEREDRENISSYELIPRVLSCCQDTIDAEEFLRNVNISDKAFSDDLAPAPLHWMIADRKRAIVVEQTESGLAIYENTLGVLTNNPVFDVQMQSLSNYMQVSPYEPENKFSENLEIKPCSRGMGGIGLPGDWSSQSRFVKACFLRENTFFADDDCGIVNDFFHILYSVFHQRGCVRMGGECEITRYSSCCNLNSGVYYYTTYNDSTIRGVDMMRENRDGSKLLEFELKTGPIEIQNR